MLFIGLEEQATKAHTSAYLPAAFIQQREKFYMKRTRSTPVWVTCGDDRPICDSSAHSLAQEYSDVADIRKGTISIYGQFPGIAKNVLVAGIAQYGAEFANSVGGFSGILNLLIRSSANDSGAYAIRPALHSDAKAEKTASEQEFEDAEAVFCAHGNSPLGCAYCNGIGATSHLVAKNDAIFEVAKEDMLYVFGNDSGLAALREGHRLLDAGEMGQDFAYGREKYAASKLPVQILEGIPHVAAEKTGLIINLDPLATSNAYEAHQEAKDFYRNDIAAVTLMVCKLLKKYRLSADLLMKAFIIDQVPVRAVLAAHDNSENKTADPRRISLGVRGGTVASALAAIQEQLQAVR